MEENQSTPIINHFSAILRFKDQIDSPFDFENNYEELIKLLDLNVVKKFAHEFDPIGKTIIYVLSESHLSIHTWPEYKLLHLDLVTCKFIDKDKVEDSIKQSFQDKELANLSLKKHDI